VPVIQLEENNFDIVPALVAATKLTWHGKHCIEKGTGFVTFVEDFLDSSGYYSSYP